MSNRIKVEISNHVAQVILSRSEKMNAIDIASKNPLAIEAAKRIFNKIPYLNDEDALMQDSVEQESIALTKHQLESIAAAMTKRSAIYENTR